MAIAMKETYTVQKLTQLRDELEVKMHLAKADTRDQWEKLEQKWQDLQTKVRTVGAVSAGAGGEVGEAAKHLMKELGEGYEKIRRSF